MKDQLDKIADSHYVDYMELIDYVPIKNSTELKPVHNDKWFKLEKITSNDSNHYNCSVEISLEDRVNNTTQLITTYHSGVWKSAAKHAKLDIIFWQYVKTHPNRFKKIFKRLADNTTDKNMTTFIIKIKTIKRYFKIKLKRLFK